MEHMDTHTCMYNIYVRTYKHTGQKVPTLDFLLYIYKNKTESRAPGQL